MTPSELTARVSAETGVLAAAGALPALWLGGGPAAVGVLTGGALAILNFRWLAGRALRAAASGTPGLWLLGAVLRLAASAGVVAALFAGGWAHPAAFLAGLTVLPCDLIARGLRVGSLEG
jgi:hypothetical protein